ncbi:hypothetical protein [Methylobacterium sp. E-045]|uniref:hypothetical protein n=1 Tax=Methylobacterium sp. E-045 TaxID=2836575 RepID=UPI001FBC0807|nr:hypothetical protein [Methylobacterium sp. E-045]MCJ2131324.1 hypothetical protein [Methylobacterium sp. E-045]
MTTLLTVLKSGGRYDAAWVERLARGARRHAPSFDRILCLTDLPIEVAGVERVPLRHDWPAWWAKMEAFRPSLTQGPTLLCDLDTVFTDSADALAEPGLAAMEDYFHKGRLSSALLRWDGGELDFIYTTFAAEPARWMTPGACGSVPNAVHGDQVVIDRLVRREGLHVDFLQRLYPNLLDFYDPRRSDHGPVVIFIGDAKPDTATGPVRAAWAEA